MTAFPAEGQISLPSSFLLKLVLKFCLRQKVSACPSFGRLFAAPNQSLLLLDLQIKLCTKKGALMGICVCSFGRTDLVLSSKVWLLAAENTFFKWKDANVREKLSVNIFLVNQGLWNMKHGGFHSPVKAPFDMIAQSSKKNIMKETEMHWFTHAVLLFYFDAHKRS